MNQNILFYYLICYFQYPPLPHLLLPQMLSTSQPPHLETTAQLLWYLSAQILKPLKVRILYLVILDLIYCVWTKLLLVLNGRICIEDEFVNGKGSLLLVPDPLAALLMMYICFLKLPSWNDMPFDLVHSCRLTIKRLKMLPISFDYEPSSKL